MNSNAATYKHFVITLFNLNIFGSRNKKKENTATEKWLLERFSLFEKYCLPSFAQQSNKNFIWLCFFDTDRTKPHMDKIEKYKVICPQFTPCFFHKDKMDNWRQDIYDIIKSYSPEDVEYVITTNVDNDDSIHKDMIDRIQHEFKNKPQAAAYTFVYGYQYFLNINILLKMHYPHNHFISLAEKNNVDMKTIIYISHAQIHKYHHTIKIIDGIYWMEVVHHGNVNNDLRITSRIKYYPIFKTISLKNFGLDITIKKSTNINNQLTRFPVYFIKTAIHKLTKKIKKKR